MKKEMQKAINAMCETAYDMWLQDDTRYPKVSQLYSCKAYVYDFGGYFKLESYGTTVAIYNIFTHEFFDILRKTYGYTATSAQHISKFKRWLDERGYEIANSYRYYPI